ncbi:MAG: hypothetical protein AAF847_06665, partial [Bacteroidota bacterium]
MRYTNIKYAFRRLLKQPVFTSINGIGLTLGLIAFLFIVQYVNFQWSFNEMYPNVERTYRLLDAAAGEALNPLNAPGIVPRVKEQIPGVELAARLMEGIGSGTILVEQAYKGQSLSRERVTFVDSDFLKIFELPVLSGTPDLTA